MINRAGDITSRLWLFGGFFFLYLPIVTLIVLSFNASPLVTTWAGFSFKWYGALVNDAAIIEGFLLSLKIAFLSATASVVLGTFAAVALVKFKRFPGRTLFSGMVNSPLVMPEVIIGLSLLLMLVSIQRATGFPERGVLTIWIGHTLLGMAYATVVVTSRLREMNPQLEEAALDLGARPWQVFFLITLPLISQALMSGVAAVVHAFAGRCGVVCVPLRSGIDDASNHHFQPCKTWLEPHRQCGGHADGAGCEHWRCGGKFVAGARRASPRPGNGCRLQGIVIPLVCSSPIP